MNWFDEGPFLGGISKHKILAAFGAGFFIYTFIVAKNAIHDYPKMSQADCILLINDEMK